MLYSLIIAVGIALDHLTKFLAVKFLAPIDYHPIIEGVLHLKYHENTGMAFGLLQDAPWVFNTVSVIAILLMTAFIYLGHVNSTLQAVAITMIISGGIGNMIERIGQGYVVDFIYVKLIDFPIFNVADSLVCIGAGLLILALIIEIVRESKAKKDNGGQAQ